MHRVVFVKTTESCQLNCSHCFTGGSSSSRDFLNITNTLDWLRRFRDYVSEDDFHIELHGGEPMLLPTAQLKELIEGIRKIDAKATIGVTTNLVYRLTEDLLEVFDSLDSIGTSWDKELRFSNVKQEKLWLNNLRSLRENGKEVSLNIAVSNGLIAMDEEDLLHFIKSTGCYRVSFDRISINGSARNAQHLFPSNEQINGWYLRLHDATQRLGARHWFENVTLEAVYDKFEKGLSCSGTFCRNCEQYITTINANGTIGGCPNSAPEDNYGHIESSISSLLQNAKRFDIIAKEATPHSACLGCEVFAYCGGDCHQLKWQGDVCPAPKQLMRKLAGLEYQTPTRNKRVIPIKGI